MKKRCEFTSMKDLVFFRVFPAFGLIVSLVSIILPPWFKPLGNLTVHYPLVFQIIHILSSVLFILILVFPFKYYFYALIGLILSIYLPFEQADPFYTLLYAAMLLGALYYMDFFKSRRIIKIIAICFFYFSLIFAQLVFQGKDFFLKNIFSYLVVFSLLVISLVFIFSVKSISYKSTQAEPPSIPSLTLNLSDFGTFTEREIIILCKILQNEKYDFIARSLGLSEITVKKSAAKIFDKLQCTDKFDLFGKYSNCAVVEGDKVYLTATREEGKALKNIAK